MIRVILGSVPRRRDNMLQGRPKGCLAGHSAVKGCLSGICGGEKRKTNIAADYAVKVPAFTALLCRHIGSIRTFLKS